MRRPPLSTNTGFSLLEMITAMTIGLVVSVIGFSGMTMFQNKLPIKSTTDRFVHALSTARSAAIGQNSFFQVTVDLDNESFWIDEVLDPLTNAQLPPFNIIKPKVIPPEKLEKRIEIESILDIGSNSVFNDGLQFFIYRPDGSAVRDAKIYFIRKTDDSDKAMNFYTVRLYGPTGASQIFPNRKI